VRKHTSKDFLARQLVEFPLEHQGLAQRQTFAACTTVSNGVLGQCNIFLGKDGHSESHERKRTIF
jgi:hypothetical protein